MSRDQEMTNDPRAAIEQSRAGVATQSGWWPEVRRLAEKLEEHRVENHFGQRIEKALGQAR